MINANCPDCNGTGKIELLTSTVECNCTSRDYQARFSALIMKVIICGDRYWLNQEIIRNRLAKLPKDVIIVEGGCEGADLLSRKIALDIGLEVVEFPAAWKKYGLSAGPRRNIRMLNTQPDGTKHIVNEARARGIEVEVIGGQ